MKFSKSVMRYYHKAFPTSIKPTLESSSEECFDKFICLRKTDRISKRQIKNIINKARSMLYRQHFKYHILCKIFLFSKNKIFFSYATQTKSLKQQKKIFEISRCHSKKNKDV